MALRVVTELPPFLGLGDVKNLSHLTIKNMKGLPWQSSG